VLVNDVDIQAYYLGKMASLVLVFDMRDLEGIDDPTVDWNSTSRNRRTLVETPIGIENQQVGSHFDYLLEFPKFVEAAANLGLGFFEKTIEPNSTKVTNCTSQILQMISIGQQV
jgi:hypothetical protein